MAQSKEWYYGEGPAPRSPPSPSTQFPEPNTKGPLDIMAMACRYCRFSRLIHSLSKQTAAALALAPAELSSLLRQGVMAEACQAQVGTIGQKWAQVYDPCPGNAACHCTI